jgi:hypothetical protein
MIILCYSVLASVSTLFHAHAHAHAHTRIPNDYHNPFVMIIAI